MVFKHSFKRWGRTIPLPIKKERKKSKKTFTFHGRIDKQLAVVVLRTFALFLSSYYYIIFALFIIRPKHAKFALGKWTQLILKQSLLSSFYFLSDDLFFSSSLFWFAPFRVRSGFVPFCCFGSLFSPIFFLLRFIFWFIFIVSSVTWIK